MAINYYRETKTQEDADGNITETVVERTHKVVRNGEPDYIKIYTNMWCEFNNIPSAFRELFLQLAVRMTYADAADKTGGQIVYTGGPVGDSIRRSLGWKDRAFYKGLNALCECNAIRKISKACYQINPSYAGRGEWKYNPRLQRGGVEDLVAKFNFRDKTVDTEIVWADDGAETPFNIMYRGGLGVKASDHTILKTMDITNPPTTPAPAETQNAYKEDNNHA